jgi:3-isopropylmalate dehydrogenase
MKTYKIAIIPGDGIGSEVIKEGWKVLTTAADKYGFKLESQTFDFGAQRYLKSGETLTDNDINTLKTFDAIYLGAIGHPDVKPGILEKGILLKLRFDFDQYINLRPVRLYENVETPLKGKTPKDINYTVVRENTGGLYTGEGGIENKGTQNEVATQKMIYSRKQVERCVRYAFEYVKKQHTGNPWGGLSEKARKNGSIGKLTLCGKSNVLTYVFDLWQRVFDEVAKEYPEIQTEYVHVDAICIYMIESPERFNAIVTTNMFGDIITDLAAVTQGGMGVAPSGNINPKGVSMFEPVHGSAPQFAGKGVVNPVACIAAGKMMLEHLGEEKAAAAVEKSLAATIKKMQSMLVGQMGLSTAEIGDMVAKSL